MPECCLINKKDAIPHDWKWNYTLTGEPALFANRGFTGHEFLPEFNLYNMNSRLYDPVIGRFLNPDNLVQDLANTQSYNHYSYCLNNPLKYTDPSGNKWNWNWLNPFYPFMCEMQLLNDITTGLRKKMSNAGIPDFGVGVNTTSAKDVNYNYSINGQEVYNSYSAKTENAVQGLNVDFYKLQNIAQNNVAQGGGVYAHDLGEIRPYEPNIFERFSASGVGKSIAGRVLYGVVDDAWVTAQCFTVGHNNAFHLSRAYTIGNETVTSGINTLTNFVPIGSFDSFLGIGEKTLNAGQFNSLMKGTGITAAQDGGVQILLYNNTIRQSTQLNKIWNFIGPASTVISYW